MSDVYDRLREPFEEAAYSKDTSRGFELTSIKAAYVFERLNEVFGLCGTGWRYAHSPFEEHGKEVITGVAFQYEVTADTGCGRVEWDNMMGAWRTVEGSGWSEPIFSAGGNQVGSGSIPVTDARKSAITNGITKAASMIGVGSDVFKGLVRAGNRPQPQRQQPAQQARERAKQPASSGKVSRPMKPDQVQKALEIKAGAGTAIASEKQAGFVARLAQEIWPDDDGKSEQNYHSCLQWLFDVDSATKLTKGQASAFITYLRQEPDSTDNWGLHPDAIKEMNHILTVAIKDAGQTTLEMPFGDAGEDGTDSENHKA